MALLLHHITFFSRWCVIYTKLQKEALSVEGSDLSDFGGHCWQSLAILQKKRIKPPCLILQTYSVHCILFNLMIQVDSTKRKKMQETKENQG